MLFTWLPGYGKHILTQFFLGWMWFLVAGASFWGLPWTVHAVLGYGPDEVTHNAFASYFWLVLSAYSVVFYGFMRIGEIQKKNAEAWTDESTQILVRSLARKAGFRRIPTIVQMKGRFNAAALMSPFGKCYVILMGGIERELRQEEFAPVIAHELSHMKHGDNIARALIVTGSIVFSVKIALLALGILEHSVLVLLTGTGGAHLLYLVELCGLVLLLYAVYGLASLAHSRAREYLADIGGIALAGLEYRRPLVDALVRLGEPSARGRTAAFRRRLPAFFLQDHPSTADRAEALRVPYGQAVTYVEVTYKAA